MKKILLLFTSFVLCASLLASPPWRSAQSQTTDLSVLLQILSVVEGSIAAGANIIGGVFGSPNVTPTDCSGTITSGTTAQNAIAATATIHGITIANIDSSAGSGEPLWISLTTTAAAGTVASYPLPAPASSTYVGMGSYTTPFGFGSNNAVSVVAATTGHKFSCTYW